MTIIVSSVDSCSKTISSRLLVESIREDRLLLSVCGRIAASVNEAWINAILGLGLHLLLIVVFSRKALDTRESIIGAGKLSRNIKWFLLELDFFVFRSNIELS